MLWLGMQSLTVPFAVQLAVPWEVEYLVRSSWEVLRSQCCSLNGWVVLGHLCHLERVLGAIVRFLPAPQCLCGGMILFTLAWLLAAKVGPHGAGTMTFPKL